MPNPTWPAALPQYFQADGLDESKVDNAITTAMEDGTIKRRRRFTKTAIKVNGALMMTDAQKAILDTFFATTCVDGALFFDWVLPSDGSAVTYIWLKAPKSMSAGALNWRSTLELQTVP